jgi:hypothetical protein
MIVRPVGASPRLWRVLVEDGVNSVERELPDYYLA